MINQLIAFLVFVVKLSTPLPIVNIVFIVKSLQSFFSSKQSSGRSGPSTYSGVEFDRRNVRATHGLAGMMQSF
jgi:hypothetical protein